jgi:hypothetical protein
MKTFLGLILMLALSNLACGPHSPTIPDPRFSEVRELIINQVTEGGVPSIAVAVAEECEIVWEESFGWSDVENRVRATPHTMYRLGSISQTITATGLMILVEQGLVDLDKPATDYYTKALERIPPYRDGYPGAGGNYASAHDLIRFAMFTMGDHLPDQKAILSDQAVRSMRAEYSPSNRRYGLGWYLDADELGYRSVSHGAEEPGADTILRLFPSEDVAAVVLCNAECEKLFEIQKAIFTALIPELSEPDRDEASSTGQRPEDLSERCGIWKGQIIAYDRALDVELIVDSLAARVGVADQPQEDVDLMVLTPTFLLGMFDARIPTPDNERRPYRNRLAVIREGDRLYGAVTSVGRLEARAGHYELSSRVELRDRHGTSTAV